MKLLHYFSGIAAYRITGAAPEQALSRFAKEGINIWNISSSSEFSCEFWGFVADAKALEQQTLRCCCELTILWEKGFLRDVKRVVHRPFLLVGVLAALVLSFLLQSRLWILEVQDCEQVQEGKILQVLQEMGVQLGTKAADLDTQAMKYELLQRIPELSWVAVNRSGGRLCVLSLGREKPSDPNPLEAAHMIACRDGIVTELNVLEGMELCQVGDSVKKGQLLVSGVEDYGLYMKAVRADGEIYGQTWHKGTVVLPVQEGKKAYTGRVWSRWSILFGRKRINLSRNSSIPGVLCDKMIDTKQLRLPGYSFPLYLEHSTYREYTLVPHCADKAEAEQTLSQAWDKLLLSSMVAGRAEQTTANCFENNGLYILQAESTCHELLSRTLPIQPPYEGDDSQWNES